ncbi:MAG TPA: hypothetical protein VK421_12010 [Pyrinomonadaceae bacterium]|nr:hypothetical protein [Pyrinomonadaceae bacterium]
MEDEPRPDAPASASRRRFAKTVAAALVAAPLAHVAGQTPPATKEATAPPNPQPTPSPQQPPPPSPLALAYVEVARLRFGEKLSEEDVARLRRDVAGNLRAADALRAVKLKNSDEPDFVFSA